MRKLSLDPNDVSVATFEPTPAQRAAALSGDTSDEICYCLSLLAEDCFGPSAGCSTDSIDQA
ncbi:MAG TPA: hypothetical protein VFJ82_09465 [Longimicrobium sp.]|nr:hypothetical protein [Longimicrobium sp.]